MKNLYIGIGIALGMLFGVPLMFFVINTLFHKGNNVKSVIPEYIKNSKEIQVTIPKRKFRDSSSLLTYKDTSYVSTLKKNGNGDLFKIVFYDTKYKKYFIIRLFDYGSYKKNYFLPNVLEQKEALLTVNNDDLSSNLYGSKYNPLPVFKYRGLSPINFGGYDYDITPEEYKYNVTQYLTYMMPKEDFQKRFGKD